MGSPGVSGAPPTAATAASMLGQRCSGSFSSIRITAAARSAGTSGRTLVIGGGGWWKWAYMIAMTETAVNGSRPVRSEEHTSELQSRVDLVCRLLLEKKTQSTQV